MFFIPRNNKIYSYVAHTDLKRCYMATFIGVCAFFIVGAYGLYFPLLSYNILLQSEQTVLEKQLLEITHLDKNNHDLSYGIESSKKKIEQCFVHDKTKEEHCYSCVLSLLHTISQINLALNTYNWGKEKDKKWYVKNVVHFNVNGTVQQLIMFLENMKKTSFMLTISQLFLKRISDDIFQMSFDAGFVVVKPF